MSDLEDSINLRVYFADTDAGGVAHHATYVRWFEQARTEFLAKRNLHVAKWTNHGIVFVVANLVVKYIKPIYLDSMIKVTVKINEVHNAWVSCEQEIYANEELMATASVKLVCVNLETKKPVRIPENLKLT